MKQVVLAQTRFRALPIIMEGIAAGRGYRLEHWNTLKFAVNRKTKTIYVPQLRVIGSDEDAVCLEGGIDHELMHVDQTDPEIQVTDPAQHRLWNIIEDVRGELGFFRKYPGCARNVRDTLNVLARKGCFERPSSENAFNVLCAFLLFELRAGILGQTQFCSGVREETAHMARQLFGTLADDALGIARDVVLTERGYPGSYKALEAAVRILALFSSPQDQEASSQSGADGKQDDKREGSASDQNSEASKDAEKGETSSDTNGEGESQGNGTPDGKGSKNAPQPQGEQDAPSSGSKTDGADSPDLKAGGHEPPSSPSHQAQGDQSANSSGRPDSQGGSGASTHGSPTPEQIHAAAKAVEQGQSGLDCPYGKGLEEHISGKNGLDLEERVEKPTQGKGVFSDGRCGAEGSQAIKLRNLQQSNRVTLSLSLKLEELLSAIANVEQRYARSGRFEPERAVLTAIGNRRVYRRKAAEEHFSTAVCMLVDNSASMARRAGRNVQDPTVMQLANASIIGMGNVLDQNEIPFSVISFSDNSRLEHDFEDSWKKTLARYCVEHDCGTRMGEAYLHAVAGLIQRDELRRIILLITDGKPADWTSLEVSIAEAKRWGIETRTVLICPDEASTTRFAEMNTAPGVARTAQEVPRAIFKTLEQSLRS